LCSLFSRKLDEGQKLGTGFRIETLRVFENGVLRRIFGLKTEKVAV
jgi:hypothetical protein